MPYLSFARVGCVAAALVVAPAAASAFCVDNKTSWRLDFGLTYPGGSFFARFKARGVRPGESKCCHWSNKGCNPSGRRDARIDITADFRRQDQSNRNPEYRRFKRLGGGKCTMSGQARGRFIAEIRNGRWHCRATWPNAVDYQKKPKGQTLLQIQLHSNRGLCVDSGARARHNEPVRLVRCATLTGLRQLRYPSNIGTNAPIRGANNLCLTAGGPRRDVQPVVWGSCIGARGPRYWLTQTVHFGGRSYYFKTWNAVSRMPGIGPKGGTCLMAERLAAGARLKVAPCRKQPAMRWMKHVILR